MISLSVCMIVKNEEEVLKRCLSCVKKIADEIIIVDTGSTDKTVSIAREFTDKIYNFKWCYDFSKARNYSFSKATKDYIMWIDADDVILSDDICKINNLKERLNKDSVDMVMMKYNMGVDSNNQVVLSYYRERIFKRAYGYKWVSPIHEVIVPEGKYIFEDIAITHKKVKQSDLKRNITIFEKMIENNINMDARQKFYYARELFYIKDYSKALKVYIDFLDDKEAWVENKISACIDMAKIYTILNDKNNTLLYLLKSFEYDIPRAEVCCELGNYFLQNNMYKIAIYWYEEALKKEKNIESGGFFYNDCYAFIPHIQLCVCYDKIGEYEKANYYNELANIDKPNNKFYLNNKLYLDEKIGKA